MADRDPVAEDFVGKRISRIDTSASNVWRFYFEDGSAIAIEAEVLNTQYGGIPFMQVCEECAVVDLDIVQSGWEPKIGDRVRIICSSWGHPNLQCLTGVHGTISKNEEPFENRFDQRRYEVTFDAPVGQRGLLNFFPLYQDDLVRITPGDIAPDTAVECLSIPDISQHGKPGADESTDDHEET